MKIVCPGDYEDMRVLLLGFWFAEIVTNLAIELSKYVDVSLVVPDYLKNRLHDKLAHISRVNWLSADPNPFSPWNLRMRNQLINLLDAEEPDVIHMQFDGHLMWLPKTGMKRSKVFVTIHDIVPHPGQFPLGFAPSMFVALLMANGFFVHGQHLKNEFAKRYGNDRRVFPIPLPPMLFDARIPNTGSTSADPVMSLKHPYFLFLGSLKKYKGLRQFIQASAIVESRTNGSAFVIAGAGNLKEHDLSAARSIRGMVLMNRYIPERDLPALLKNAICVVLPYTEASQSGIIPIAYHFSKPVITTRVGALTEVVRNGRTGLLVEQGDSNALAEAMLEMLENPDAAATMGAQAKKMVETELSWKELATRTLEAYESVLAEGG